MGLQTHDGRDVRIQQAGRSYADVVQLSGPAVRECRPRQDALTDEPYTMHQVSQLDHSLSTYTHFIVHFDYIQQSHFVPTNNGNPL